MMVASVPDLRLLAQAAQGQLPEPEKLPGRGGTNIKVQSNSSFAAALPALAASSSLSSFS